MKWVTRKNANVDRVACPYLIRRFVDPDAEFLYVPADEVGAVAEREGAIPYDVKGVELGHVDGRCSFESIMVKYGLDDPGLGLLARIVHRADVAADIDIVPEAAGLKAIAHGFALWRGQAWSDPVWLAARWLFALNWAFNAYPGKYQARWYEQEFSSASGTSRAATPGRRRTPSSSKWC